MQEALLHSASGGSASVDTGATTAAITVSAAGTYAVTATDGNGCTAAASRTLTVNAIPTSSGVTFDANPICSGSSTTINSNASAGSGTISGYAWSSGVSPSNAATGSVSTAGPFTVTVTNSNTYTQPLHQAV
ncbi:MAG: hypothetical protein IPH78_12675 [Bacteroidetes bacterium]|nr:hypothetical protein [Bacteroidota bacterium]